MPSYTRGEREINSVVRAYEPSGDLITTPSRRKGLTRAGHRNEPFTGQEYNNAIISSAIPNEWDIEEAAALRDLAREVDFLKKRISTFTDDRGRARSEYFTDEKGRLKVPYGSMFENSDDSPTAITLTTAGTWYGWVSAGDDITYGVPYISFSDNGTADRLLIGSDGDGVWEMSVSVDGDQGAAEAYLLTAAIFVNDVQDSSLTGATEFTAAQQVQAIPISGHV
ncbi:MAG: hypothetical protein ACYSW3_26255, partial [Planctomycetota bacterium]